MQTLLLIGPKVDGGSHRRSRDSLFMIAEVVARGGTLQGNGYWAFSERANFVSMVRKSLGLSKEQLQIQPVAELSTPKRALSSARSCQHYALMALSLLQGEARKTHASHFAATVKQRRELRARLSY
jgi:hypothetical protein